MRVLRPSAVLINRHGLQMGQPQQRWCLRVRLPRHSMRDVPSRLTLGQRVE
jgi:hypothetical protein